MAVYNNRGYDLMRSSNGNPLLDVLLTWLNHKFWICQAPHCSYKSLSTFSNIIFVE